jgi:alkanesulfonate monooxygenase SsuD/methylene tetrahydromethanopterin reductase-like flavin-dependent oxidoreductase (luciferase family)
MAKPPASESTLHTLRFGLCYDFRNPPDSGLTHPELYRAALRQIEWADQAGFDLIWFTEHHFVDDGYLPSWIPVASAAAARTSRVRFGTDICLLPFNHPVRLAEDLAVLDNLSGGRVEVGVGMGYAPHEFKGFGIPVARRVSLMEEGIEILQRCFAGETFSYSGKRYQLDKVRITPGYVQPGGPPLWVAAMSEAGARRAARYGTHFLPQGRKETSFDPWVNAVTQAGRKPGDHRVGIIRGILPTPDKERDWPRVRVAERYRMALYNRFFAESGEGLGGGGEPVPQNWIVGTVDECVAELVDFIRRFGITDIVTWGIPPGMHPDQMAEPYELLIKTIIPQVRAVVG